VVVRGVVGQQVVDRLLHVRSPDAPMLSVYVGIPSDPGELRSVESRIHSLLKPVRELVDSSQLGHYERESLRADVARVIALATRTREYQGRTVAIVACQRADLYEEIAIPAHTRDRAVVDATPYLRPLLAALDEAHRYCVVVVDRARAWVYEFFMKELEEATSSDHRIGQRGTSARHVLEEHGAHERAEELDKRHFRKTAGATEELVQRTGAELVIVGGHEETVSRFIPFLPNELRNRVAGTFVIDPHTMTPAEVRERAEHVVDAYEREEEARLVDRALERVATGGMGATGLDWCLLAVNEKAVELLLIHDDSQVPGRACDNCGWLGLAGDECPVCGQQTRGTADVIDEMAEAVVDAGGRVEHVYTDTALSRHVVAALLRCPVQNPGAAPTG